MPAPTKGKRLGGSPAHERLMLANLATSLFRHRRITTTETKARRLRPFAERLVTKAKRGDLHARRKVHAVIRDKSVVHTLFAEIGPGFSTRPGGYTRITKVGPRKGDNAPMAVIELVEFAAPAAGGAVTTEAPASTSTAPDPGVTDAEATVDEQAGTQAEPGTGAETESEAASQADASGADESPKQGQ